MTIPKLQDAIEAFRANDIGTMLRLAGISEIPKTKEGKVLLWAQQIGDPARIRGALARLTPRCLKALQQLQSIGGEVRTVRYRSLLERAGLLGKESRQRRPRGTWSAIRPEDATDPVTFEEVLAALLKYGLIWTHTLPANAPSNAKLGFEGGRFVYIPPEVARHLPPVPEKEQGPLQVTHILEGSARACQRDLYLLWSVAREAPLQLTNTGLLRVSDLKRVSGQLLTPENVATGTKESDYRRVFFLRRLLSALGLLKGEGDNGSEGRITAVADPPFLRMEPTRRVQASFQSWRDGAWWNELWATYVQGETRASGSITDFAPAQIVRARRTVLDTLARLARRGAEWIALDRLVDLLHDQDDEFLIDRETAERQSYYYYSRTSSSPYLANSLNWVWEKYSHDEDAGWEGVEGVFIRAVLTEGLYWLGLVDLGYAHAVAPTGGTAPDGLLAVRLTDMGRWLLLDGPVPAIPAETGRVIVQPNFRIFAFDPIADSVLARLDTFATRVKAERAIEYELSRESVYRAQLAGQDVGQIIAWLETVTGTPLPQNVLRSLQEWQAAFERIIVWSRVGWLQVAEPELADALLADPTLSTAIIKRMTPTAFLVRADRVNALEAALLAAGELPARTSKPEDARPASITVTADGEIGFAHATPSLYVYGFLHPFADRVEAGPDGPVSGWQITEDSVKRARAAGLDALRIIGELEAMTLGDVPEALRRKIKAWCKYYGDATVQSVTLIQFRDQDALDELCTDPTLARYLTPFRPEARLGLATVQLKDLDTVRALLAERGVTMRETKVDL